jgi:ABC-type dipeptide/oligopeptide/nickel transport system permease subunit
MKNPKFLMHLISGICACYLALLFILTLAPQLVTLYSPTEQNAQFILQTPSHHFLLGTDELGRDLTSRILYGARVSLSASLAATVIAGLIGLFYGSISGWAGGKLDAFLMRFLDILYSVPDLLLAIILGFFLGRNFWGLVVALSVASWITPARVMRGETLKYKTTLFIESAQALGLSPWRILTRHLFPQLVPTLSVLLLVRIPLVMMAESTLSFIGLGLNPPYSSWGSLANEGYQAINFYPHLLLFPCIFIVITIYSFQTVGKFLQEKNRS